MIDIGNGAERIKALNTVAGPYQGFDIEPTGELTKVEKREPDEPRDLPTFFFKEPVPESIQTSDQYYKEVRFYSISEAWANRTHSLRDFAEGGRATDKRTSSTLGHEIYY